MSRLGFTQPCALSPLPACYVTNTSYTGCLSNPAAAAAIQPAGVGKKQQHTLEQILGNTRFLTRTRAWPLALAGAVIMSALVFLETAAFAGYLGYQQAWIGTATENATAFGIANEEN